MDVNSLNYQSKNYSALYQNSTLSFETEQNGQTIDFEMKLSQLSVNMQNYSFSYSQNNSTAQANFFDALQTGNATTINDFLFSLDTKSISAVNSFDLSSESLTYQESSLTISGLSVEEAEALVSDDGYFGVSSTSQRVADFVLKGANGDVELLQAGRDGIIKGFNEAESIWGGTLPDISYETLEKTLEIIDEAISEAGAQIIDQKG